MKLASREVQIHLAGSSIQAARGIRKSLSIETGVFWFLKFGHSARTKTRCAANWRNFKNSRGGLPATQFAEHERPAVPTVVVEEFSLDTISARRSNCASHRAPAHIHLREGQAAREKTAHSRREVVRAGPIVRKITGSLGYLRPLTSILVIARV